MSADGTWAMTITTPRGEAEATLTLAGGATTGTFKNRLGVFDITQGGVEGGSLTWRAKPADNPAAVTTERYRSVEAKDGTSTDQADGDGPRATQDNASDGDGPRPTAEELAQDPVFVEFSGTIDGDSIAGDLTFGGGGRRMTAAASGKRT